MHNIHACLHAYIQTYSRTHTHTHARAYNVCVYLCMYVCMYACMYIYIYNTYCQRIRIPHDVLIHVYICTYANILNYSYIHTYIHTYRYIYIYTYVHIARVICTCSTRQSGLSLHIRVAPAKLRSFSFGCGRGAVRQLKEAGSICHMLPWCSVLDDNIH